MIYVRADQWCLCDFIFYLWQELERRLALQEQDMAVVTTVKLEVEKVPELENEVKRLQEENNFLR